MVTPQNSRVTLHCGIAPLRRQVALALSTQGIAVGPDADTALLLDAPVGWALWRYPQLEQSRSVIISDNPCPEYRLELLESGCLTLLGGRCGDRPATPGRCAALPAGDTALPRRTPDA